MLQQLTMGARLQLLLQLLLLPQAVQLLLECNQAVQLVQQVRGLLTASTH
jgi:hypothetical protein